MQFSYIFAAFVAIGAVAAAPTEGTGQALEGTTDDNGRMLRIFKLAAVKKTKAQMENDRLAPGSRPDDSGDVADDKAKDA